MRLRNTLLGTVGALSLALCVGQAAIAADPIKVGLLEDVSGDLAVFGKPKLNGSLLAVEEINKSGGILGAVTRAASAGALCTGAQLFLRLGGSPRSAATLGRCVLRTATGTDAKARVIRGACPRVVMRHGYWRLGCCAG